MLFSGIASLFGKSLWIDEGYSNLTSLVISQRGIPLYASGYFDGSYLFFHYLQAAVFALVGYSDAVSRVVPFAFGVASLWLVYLVGREIFDRRTGLFAAACTALSYPYLVAVTQARYYAAMIFLYLLGIWLVARFLRRGTSASFFLALNAVFFAAIYHVYLYSLFVLVAFALACRLWPLVRGRGVAAWREIPWRFVGIALLNTAAFWIVLQWLNPGASAANIVDTLRYVRFDYAEQYAGFFLRDFGVFFAFAFGAFAVWYRFARRDLAVLLLLAFFFPYLVISKWVFLYAERYVYFLMPLCVLLGTAFFWHVFESLRRPVLRYAFCAVCLVAIAFSFRTWPAHSGPWTMQDPYAPEPDFAAAYRAVRADPRYSPESRVVSAYPHMDELYLGRSDGYLYIDETGIGLPPAENFYVRDGRNIFTLAPVLLSEADLDAIPGGVFLLVDQLSFARLRSSPVMAAIVRDFRVVFEKADRPFYIRVYYRPAK